MKTELAQLPGSVDTGASIPRRFAEVVRAFPDRIALSAHGRSWTYSELDRLSGRIANAIREHALSGSGCVVYLADHSAEMVITALAILKAGKTWLALHPAMPAARQSDIIRDVAPELIVATGAQESRAEQLSSGGRSILLLDEVPADGPWETYSDASPQQPATVFYTSGSTGRPKGVVKSHRAVLHRVWLATELDGVSPADRISLLTHASFAAAETDMFGALLSGATLCVFDLATEGLDAFAEWIDAEQVTLLHPPVLFFRRFLAAQSGEDRFPSVRQVSLAGDKVLPADVTRWSRHFSESCVFMHRFSTTETGLLCAARITRSEARAGGVVLAGTPVPGKRLELADGELVVTSEYLADGYWNGPAFHGVYHTGDLGRFLSDGRFEFTGRRDNQVKLRGFRVELGDIEAALTGHPGVREAAVVLRERAPNDPLLAGWIVAHNPQPSTTELREFLARTLPPYMVPARYGFIERLPVTPTGKVDRGSLGLPESTESNMAPAEPRSAAERELVNIWQSVLGVARVGIKDNFFDLGGHSLLAAQMFSQLEARFKVRLPLAVLFRAATIEQLAPLVGQQAPKASWRSLVPIHPTGTRAPVFALPGVGGNVLGFHDLATLLGTDQPFYGLQSRGLGGTEPPLTSIEEMATVCLAEIREVQPRGPYHLVGVCMGAVVAYEMAQRLRANGEAVGLLGLIEPRPPADTVRQEFHEASRGRMALQLVGARLKSYARTFARLKGKERLQFLRERFRVATQIVAKRDISRGNRNEFHSAVVRQTNLAAVHAYKPKPYSGRVVLFLAEGRKVDPNDDQRLRWSNLAQGGIEVHKIPGNDSGLTLVRPNVDGLAPILQELLDRTPVADAPIRRRVDAPAGCVADGFLELLNDQGVTRIFINPGSDLAPIQESVAKFAAQGRRAPELVLCLHESVAMAAAHGAWMVTGRPQVVMVHADVGTQNLGANLHNAQRGRAGVVICAGTEPRNTGARTRQMDWIQSQLDHAASVRGYVKWHHEVSGAEDLAGSVQRAFQLAGSDPAGPVYLTLPKDVLLEPMAGRAPDPVRTLDTATPAADHASLAQAAQWLVESERPLILTAYAGRNAAAVAGLTRLAELLAIPVIETRHRVNFPVSHPMHLGFCAYPYVQESDCILVLDHDVPWVPAQGKPSPDCRIIHLDIDPRKRSMPVWDFAVDLSLEADGRTALPALADVVERRLTAADHSRIEARRERIARVHHALRAGWNQRARDLALRQPIAPEWAAHCLNTVVDGTTTVIAEAVSNNPALWHHLDLDTPGSYYQSLGSGLGWALGAAVGAKLGAPSRTVVCVVGDGSWIFGNPIAAYSAARQQRAPFLTVILDNQGYAATRDAIRDAAPAGYASSTGSYPACDIADPPQYGELARAMGLHARTVEQPGELEAALCEAMERTKGGQSALVHVRVAATRPYAQDADE